MNLLEGKLLAEGQRIGVVAARFNEFITAKLVGGAKDAFVRHGGDENKLDLAWVPGAFEIPLVAKKMVESGKYDAVVCLGAVIRGATPHFDMVANEATRCSPCRIADRDAGDFRYPDDRFDRTGCRKSRNESR